MTETEILSPESATQHPLRILHYIPAIWLKQGGVVRAVLDWCEVFARRGHQVVLVTYRGEDLPQAWLAGGPGLPKACVVAKPRRPFKLLDAEAMKLLGDLLNDTDIVHLHAPWLDGNRQLANLASRRGVPYVVSLHGMLDDWSMQQSPWKKRAYLALAGGRLLKRAATIHCTADAEWEQAGKWTSNRDVTVLPYLVDMRPYQNLPGPAEGLALAMAATTAAGGEVNSNIFNILFLSRLSKQKGVDRLIGAAAWLRENGVRFNLWIAGTGDVHYERQMRDLVRQLNLETRVIFLGLVTGDAKLSLYQAADLFVLATRQENFGLVITEAMASGTPVLITRGTDIWRELQNGGAAITGHKVTEIAEGIRRLLLDPAQLKQRGSTAANGFCNGWRSRHWHRSMRRCIEGACSTGTQLRPHSCDASIAFWRMRRRIVRRFVFR